jgi:hypothetical protein
MKTNFFEEFGTEESSAPFNMAIFTLYSLRYILEDIKRIRIWLILN